MRKRGPPSLSIVVARAVGPKQSHECKERLLRGVYPERSRRARNDNKENRKVLGTSRVAAQADGEEICRK